MKKLALFLIGLLFLFYSYCQWWWPLTLRDGQMLTLALKSNFFAPAEQILVVEVAKSEASMQVGLSNRSELVNRRAEAIDGLLFVYPKSKKLNFWMKEMQFPIDICWFNQLKLKSCDRQVEPKPSLPEEELPIYQSPWPSKMVLETQPNFLPDLLFNRQLFPHF